MLILLEKIYKKKSEIANVTIMLPSVKINLSELVQNFDVYTKLSGINGYKIFILFLFITLISILMFSLAFFFSLSIIKDNEKASQYECGFSPFDEATRQPFDVHFYIVGILFLIFDVEVALLFPWVLTLKSTGVFSFVTMCIFLIILTIGFFYEWHRGALLWPHEELSKENIKNKNFYETT